MGAELAREAPAAADVIVPVPDSGVPAAIGFARESGIPYELGIIRNHYVGRTFIQPTQTIRDQGVRLKHSANRAVVAGKRIVLVDDSIVRGTTSRKIVQMMRDAGAKEVHFRIASPPITHPDYYGIDTPERDKLLAATHDLEGMRQFIGADSLAFLSVDGIYRAMGFEKRDPVAAAIHRPLLHRRLSDRAHRPGRARGEPAAAVAAWPKPSRLFALALSAWPNPSPTVSRSSPAPRAALARRWRSQLAKAGAHVVAVARTVGGLEELDDKIKAAGGSATLVPLDMKDSDGIARLALALNERYQPPRRAGRQCRHSRTAVAARPLPAEGLGQSDRGQCHRQLAIHPLHGRAAASGRRPGARCSSPPGGLQGAAPIGAPMRHRKPRSTRWCAAYAAECATTKVRANLFSPGPDPHPHVSRRLSRHRSRDAADAGGSGEGDRAAVPAGMHRDRQNLRFPRGEVFGISGAGLTFRRPNFGVARFERRAEDMIPQRRRHAEISAMG